MDTHQPITLNKILAVLPLIAVILAGTGGYYVMQERQNNLMEEVKELKQELKLANNSNSALTNKYEIEALRKDLDDLNKHVNKEFKLFIKDDKYYFNKSKEMVENNAKLDQEWNTYLEKKINETRDFVKMKKTRE